MIEAFSIAIFSAATVAGFVGWCIYAMKSAYPPNGKIEWGKEA